MTPVRRPRRPEPATDPQPLDQRVARLTAKADLIVEELDDVVKQMSELLRRKYPE